jgi:TRAP-type C4-dicarboxylate transport system permease small subunit
MHWLRFFDQIFWWVSLVPGGATLIFMTGFSTWNVLVMRKALNAPIQGAEDLLILSLVVIVAQSIPLGARTGAHIEIEFLESSMTVRFAKWSIIVMKCLGAVLLVVLSWRLFHAGMAILVRDVGDDRPAHFVPKNRSIPTTAALIFAGSDHEWYISCRTFHGTNTAINAANEMSSVNPCTVVPNEETRYGLE